ncbi:MAG: hypothetical protein ABIJ97_13130 [Bacteroidota bacterium]
MAFLYISFIVKFLPNNAKFVKRKLKTGAIMLMMTAIISGCDPKGSETITCYAAQVDDTIRLESSDTSESKIDTLTLRLLKSTIIKTKKFKKTKLESVSVSDIEIATDTVIINTDKDLDSRCYMPIDDMINDTL